MRRLVIVRPEQNWNRKMKQLKIRIRRMHFGALTPSRATPGSAAIDLYSREPGMVYSEQTAVAKIGWAFEIPQGWYGQIHSRSGLAAQGVITAGGVVDSDYRGEIGIILRNQAKQPFRYEAGQRLAQMVFLPVPALLIEEVDTLETSERGGDGFGSSGV